MGVGGVNQGAATCPPFPWPPPLLACRHKALETARPGGSALGATGGQESRTQGVDEAEGPMGNGDLDPVAGERVAGCVQTPLGRRGAGALMRRRRSPHPCPPPAPVRLLPVFLTPALASSS